MENKGCITLFCAGLIFLILFPLLMEYSYALEYVDLSPWDYQKLTDVEAQMVLLDDDKNRGTVLVTETVTFDVHQSSENDLCYELWRDLPEQEVDGLDLDYTVLTVCQVMDDGSVVELEECSYSDWNNLEVEELAGTWYHSEGPYSRARDRYECVFFYVDGIYRDEVTFLITYKMNNVALRYKDCSDLYLSLYSESPIKDLESYKAEILIPDEEMPAEGNYEYYTYGSDNNGFRVTEATTLYPGYHTFTINLDEDDLQFSPYNLYLEFELVAYDSDKHIFTENARNNDYSYDYALDEIRYEASNEQSKPQVFVLLKTMAFVVLIVSSISVLHYTLTAKKRIGSQHMFYEPAEVPEYYFGIPSDLDPNFAAALVFCKDKKPMDESGVYSAILLSLARKDYVDIQETGANDALITIKNPNLTQENSIMPCEPLTESEILYYNLLVRHATGNTIYMNDFQRKISMDYENTANFDENIKKAITNAGVNGGYIQKADFTQPKDELLGKAKTYFRLAVIFLLVVNIISFHTRMDLAYGAYFIFGFVCLFGAIYLNSQASKYVLLTQLGENEYAKWRGLYNYLNSDEILRNTTIEGMPIWERYFIYATAFGIPSKVNKAIGIKCPEAVAMPDMYSNQLFSNTYIRTGRIHVSGRSMRTAVRSGARFHRASQASRGYSGGGRSFGSYGGGGS